MSLKRLTLCSVVLALLLVSVPALAWAPTQPITLVVPYAAGGSTDVLARLVAKYAPKYFNGQQMIVENRPGGGGVTGAEYVVRSKPDGYTLVFGWGSGSETCMPWLQKMPYEPSDFVTIARLSVHSVVFVVPADSPWKDGKEFMAWAKKQKKPITMSASTKAGAVDIAESAWAKAAGVKGVVVPFRGGGESIMAIVGKQVTLGANHPSEVLPHIKAGRLRPIAVSLDERDPSLPDVPTWKELGVPVVTWGSIKGVAAPKNTPKEVVEALTAGFKKIAEDPDFQKDMKNIGQPVMFQDGPTFAKWLEMAKNDYGKLIKELGYKM
ncbi:MAG: tripartite tricarboxylate transporter substrate binding protein [Chitinophagales bacterium]